MKKKNLILPQGESPLAMYWPVKKADLSKKIRHFTYGIFHFSDCIINMYFINRYGFHFYLNVSMKSLPTKGIPFLNKFFFLLTVEVSKMGPDTHIGLRGRKSKRCKKDKIDKK